MYEIRRGEIPLLKNCVNLGWLGNILPLDNPGMPVACWLTTSRPAELSGGSFLCVGGDARSSAPVAERAQSRPVDGRYLDLVTPEFGRQGGGFDSCQENAPAAMRRKVNAWRCRGSQGQRTESASAEGTKNMRRHYFPLVSSNARFSSSTFTRGSPSKPNSRCAVCFLTSSRTVDSGIPRAFATRGI
jgi:hypothetical protein